MRTARTARRPAPFKAPAPPPPPEAELPGQREAHEAPVAPWPIVDRYQTVLGSTITLQTVSSCLRVASTGYRTYYVDLLDELLEREPHGYAVLQQRIQAVAGCRVEFDPADLSEDDPRYDRAVEIASWIDSRFNAIPDRAQSLSDLLWGIYTGAAAAEIGWVRRPGDGGKTEVVPERLYFIHSRRVNYPSWNDWDVRIWDQGLVSAMPGAHETERVFGIRARDLPGKFIVHTPRLRGSYPTRDGLGRQLVWYFAIKNMAMRSASVFVERFAKPWPVARYSTTNDKNKPRPASKEDIAVATATTTAMGIGTAASAVLPDSIEVDMYGPGAAGSGKISLTHDKLIDMVNAEISKCVLGQTLTTETAVRGNSSATSVHKEGSKQLARYDAFCLAETLKRDLVAWMVKFNFPEDQDLVPHVRILVDEDPGPDEIAAVALIAAQMGLPLDAEALADQLGLKLVPKKKPEPPPEPGEEPKPPKFDPKEPRRAAWVKQVEISSIDDAIAPPAPPPQPGFKVGPDGEPILDPPPPQLGPDGKPVPPKPGAAKPPAKGAKAPEDKKAAKPAAKKTKPPKKTDNGEDR